jgi:transposase
MKEITSPRPARKGVSSKAVQTFTEVRPATEECYAVVGLDVGDKETHFCMLDAGGEFVAEGAVVTSDKGLRSLLADRPRLRVVLEAGTHSGWIGRLAQALGHEGIVANPRNLRLISRSDSKNDRNDARMLAHIAVAGPELLSPVQPRSAKTQQDLAWVRAREVAVEARTKIVNAVRGIVKTSGARLPKCSTATFGARARELCPEALREPLSPLLRIVEELTREIQLYDKLVAQKSKQEYPETAAIETIDGVGPLTALTFVLVLDNDRTRFRRSRDVGCFIGLRPKQRDSGMHSPALGITKAGDPLLRRLATQCAQYILGPFGRDSALRRWGLGLITRGGKRAKQRAVVAVARKLVILMHRLWVRQESYDPLHGVPAAAAA